MTSCAAHVRLNLSIEMASSRMTDVGVCVFLSIGDPIVCSMLLTVVPKFTEYLISRYRRYVKRSKQFNRMDVHSQPGADAAILIPLSPIVRYHACAVRRGEQHYGFVPTSHPGTQAPAVQTLTFEVFVIFHSKNESTNDKQGLAQRVNRRPSGLCSSMYMVHDGWR